MKSVLRRQLRSDGVGWSPDTGPALLMQAARDSLRLVVSETAEPGFDAPMQRARDALRSTNMAFCTRNDSGELIVRGTADASMLPIGTAIDVAGTLAGEVLTSGTAARSHGASDAGSGAARGRRERAMAVPIRSGDAVVGILIVTRTPNQPAFSEGELAALSTFGDFLGLVTEAESQRADREEAVARGVREQLAKARIDALVNGLLRASTGLSRLSLSLDAGQRATLGQYVRVVDELLLAFRETISENARPLVGDDLKMTADRGASLPDVLDLVGIHPSGDQGDWDTGDISDQMESQVAAILADIYAVTLALTTAAHADLPNHQTVILRSVTQLDELSRRVRDAATRFRKSQTAERRLQLRHTELSQSEAFLLDQIAMIGHDLRSPLSVVAMYLDDLAGDHPTTEQADRLSRAARAAQRTIELLERILTLAVTESGDLTSEPALINLAGWVPDLLLTIPRGDEIDYDSETADGPIVLFDPGQLGQILTNLVNNGFRHGAPPVTLSTRTTASATIIEVADHGNGISEDKLDHLFERDSLTTQPAPDGYLDPGLGLYLSRRLAQANAATLTYHPRTNHQQPHFALTIPNSH